MGATNQEIIGPASSYYVSQRLRLHYVDWGNEGAPPLVLIHGGCDHARSWDWVALDLRRDYHVIAPDLRGHGDSSWAIGGHYNIHEFVLDIAQLLDTVDVFPVTIIGHSLGGAAAINYTAIYPDRVKKLVAIEGLGPPPAILKQSENKPTWERIHDWIQQVRAFSSRMPRRYPSIEAAAQRMLEENSFLSPAQAHHLTVHGVARNEDATYTWKFDNYMRIFYPQRYDVAEVRDLWGRITCPTLLMRGAESWASDPSEDERVKAVQNTRLVEVPEAGHWVHHDRLDEFLREVRAFLDA
jgi:pimeloyl-ACP methyl ester carboxylesterase